MKYHQLFPPGVSDHKQALRQLQLDVDRGMPVDPAIVLEIAQAALGNESGLERQIADLQDELEAAENESDRSENFEMDYSRLCDQIKKFHARFLTFKITMLKDLDAELADLNKELAKIITNCNLTY